MLIIWKYLSKEFLKIFLLSIFIFIALLLVVRGQEIARFAMLSSHITITMLFLLYQIPFILPLAVPISILISAYLMMRSLSTSYELTSLRASGLGFFKTLFPIFVIGIILCFINFLLASEVGPHSRLKSLLLPKKTIENNPLLLLSKNSNALFKNCIIVQDLDSNKKGASNFLLATYDKGLSLTLIKDLFVTNKTIKASKISTLSSLSSKSEDEFDDLFLENTDYLNLSREDLIKQIQKPLRKVKYEFLSMKNCIIQKRLSKKTKDKNEASIEIYRRLFSLTAPLTFLLIAIAFGTTVGRVPPKKFFVLTIGLTLFVLIGFMGAKSLRTKPNLSLALFMIPQGISFCISLLYLRKTLKGAI